MTTYTSRGKKSTRSGFAEGLLAAGEKNPLVMALGADITASVGVVLFAERFPDRFFSLGIAEQNGVAVAAGLALEGKVPVFATYGAFSALRAADQIRISVCYNDLHVVIGGAHAGISVGPDGATHQVLEDMALMRALPNMTVLSPCDATQAKKATLAACNDLKGPVYIRFGREGVADFSDEEFEFVPGKAQLLREGDDLGIIATGHMVWEALLAAESLEQQGIRATVLNIHTIKPIDEEAIIRLACRTGKIVTAEEHQVHGGLGSAVAEVTARHCPVPMRFIGMNDRFGESGKPAELMRKFGLDADGIIREAINIYNNN